MLSLGLCTNTIHLTHQRVVVTISTAEASDMHVRTYVCCDRDCQGPTSATAPSSSAAEPCAHVGSGKEGGLPTSPVGRCGHVTECCLTRCKQKEWTVWARRRPFFPLPAAGQRATAPLEMEQEDHVVGTEAQRAARTGGGRRRLLCPPPEFLLCTRKK